MHFQNEFRTLYSEIEKLAKRDHSHIVDQAKFVTLKDDVLNVLKSLFGDSSREYRVVKLTDSPATVFKVMSHIAARTETGMNIAVNM